MVLDHWSNNAMVLMDRCGLFQHHLTIFTFTSFLNWYDGLIWSLFVMQYKCVYWPNRSSPIRSGDRKIMGSCNNKMFFNWFLVKTHSYTQSDNTLLMACTANRCKSWAFYDFFEKNSLNVDLGKSSKRSKGCLYVLTHTQRWICLLKVNIFA